MSVMPEGVQCFFKWLAKPLDGLRKHARPIKLATLRVAERMLRFMKSGWAEDLGRYTDKEFLKHDAETDAAIAEAKRRQAEAIAASNKRTIRKRQAEMDRLDREEREADIAQKRADTAKTEREAEVLGAAAEAIRKGIEDRRVAGMSEREEVLREVLSALRQKGGSLFFREKNLTDIIDHGLPPPENHEEEPPLLE